MTLGTRVPEPERAAAADLEARLRSHVERLASGGRSWRQPEALRAAAAHIEKTWQDAGLRVERQPIPGRGPDYVNILATPPGAGWEGNPRVFIAHYDTIHGTPGADDNASGVAVLLELGRVLGARSAGSVPVALAAVTLEEPPFFGTASQGAWVLASSLRRRRLDIRGAVVLEMVGYFRPEPGTQRYPFPLGFLGYPNTGDFLGLVANRRSRSLLDEVASVLRGGSIPLQTLALPGKGWIVPPTRFSDHAAFWDAGYPAVMLTDTAFCRNPNYHGAGDLPETLDYRMMARITEGLAVLVEGAGSEVSRSP